MKEQLPPQDIVDRQIIWHQEMLGFLGERRDMLLTELQRIDKQITGVHVSLAQLRKQKRGGKP